jgi:hypothetical protein
VKTTDINLHGDQVRDQLLPRLIGRVFHVTRLSLLERIVETGAILTNTNGNLDSTFGYPNSFFRRRGCVSLFDYRFASSEQVDTSISKCSPFHVPDSNDELAYLFLSSSTYDRLILWTKWKEEQAWSDMIVPYVESGHQGSIPLTSIEEVFKVTIEYPPDPIAEALRKGRDRARGAG